MPDLNPGTTFAGHRIEGIAGRGGMGTVYRATHIALDHVVALKVISADLAADDAFRERFRSESRIAVSLRHPNVVPIHHAGEEDGLLFVTMDLVDGPDLRKMLIADGTLPADRAIGIVGQVASALDVAHSRGLVHRDIKPGNILVERDSGDRAYLTDFGLAKRFDQATEAGALTRTGAFVGTLDYVAPEQIRGDRVDARTDVYALGCVMYEAMAGKAPFADREENVAKIYAHLQDEPPWLPGDGGSGGSLDEVISRALAKEPGDRYPSAGDLARAAAAAAEGGQIRSAERSVATGKAAPETEEPEAPPVVVPISDTVESDVAPESEPAPAATPEPAATEPFAVTAESTAENAPPTQALEADEPPAEPPASEPPAGGPSVPQPRSSGGGPRWGRIGLALAAIAAVIVAGVVVLGGGGGDGDGAGGPTAADPKVVGDPISVPDLPVGIAAGNGTVAVASRAGQTVTFIDEKNHKASEPVDLPGPGQEVAIVDGEAWVTVPSAQAVVRAPLNGGAPTTIDVGSDPYGVAGDGKSIWVAQPAAQQTSFIDPGSQSVTPVSIENSSEPTELTSGGGRVWVVDRGGSKLFSFSPGKPSDQRSVELGEDPKGVALGGGSVWVANTLSGNVLQLSKSGDKLDTIDVGGQPRLLAYGFGRVWVANGDGPVNVIDPADGNSVQSIEVGGSPEGVAVGDGEVWVTTGKNGNSVVRIDPTG